LQASLAQLRGVREVLVVASEQIACIKVEMSGFDEEAVERLVAGGSNAHAVRPKPVEGQQAAVPVSTSSTRTA
jgi:hypothetical protein